MASWEMGAADTTYALDGDTFSVPDVAPLADWGVPAALPAGGGCPWNTSGQSTAAAERWSGGVESWTTPGAKSAMGHSSAAFKHEFDEELGNTADSGKRAAPGGRARTAGGKRRKKLLKYGPKRPMSSYFFFTNRGREKLKEENPTLSVTELSKVFGQRWAVLDDSAKAQFVTLAEADKERYATEMHKWTSEHPEEVEAMAQQKKLGRAQKRGSNEFAPSTGDSPRRALSAYSFFLQKMRARVKKENPGISFGELSKLLGTMWKGLAEHDKQEYEDLAADDRTRHTHEQTLIDQYKREHPDGFTL